MNTAIVTRLAFTYGTATISGACLRQAKENKMVYGAVRSFIATSILFSLALVFGILDFPNLAGIVLAGVMVFVSGFITGNRPGPGGAFITGVFAAILAVLVSYGFFRLAASSGDSELEYLAYTGLVSSVYFLIILPIVAPLATLILDRTIIL